MVSVTAVWIRRGVQLLLVAVFFVGLVTAREIHRGEMALRASDEAFHRGDLQKSVLYARTAALSYVPGAPHVKSAYERLEAIARGAETEGRYELARTAWGAVRSSTRQTNHWLPARRAERQRAEQSLQRLDRAAAQRAEAGALARPEPASESTRPWGESQVATHGVKLLRIGLLAFGFVSLALGLVCAGWWAVDGGGRLKRRGVLLSAVLCVGGAALWLLAALTS